VATKHILARNLAALGALAALAFPRSAPAQTVDDFFLLSTSVAPNVVLFLDVSSNMLQIEWHPAYDPTATPSCTHWDNNTTYTFTSDDKNNVFCAATAAHKRTIYAPNNPTYWDGRYLNWYFSLPDNSPILTQIETATVTAAGCNGAGSSTRFTSQYRRTRADASRQVFLDVLCLAEPKNVRFSLAEFRNGSPDPNGAYISVPLDNPSPAHATDTEAHVGNAKIEPATPLAEGMFQIYTYFMPRTSSNCSTASPVDPPAYCLPKGRDGTTNFPEYSYDKFGKYDTSASGMLPDPVQYACQKNFVLVVTTGLGTRDDFDVEATANEAQGFANFNNLIGDYFAENIPPTPNPDVEVPGTLDERSLYLDDVVKYMHDKDVRPDYADNQTIDVYTIGFGTTGTDDAYLNRVAKVGNGLFYHAQDGTALAASVLSALADIIEKSRSFTAATVPSARTADGGDFYNSFFLPSARSAFWEGHLRSWHITAGGSIVDSAGRCALVDPSGQCKNGPFKTICQPGQTTGCVTPFWDAGNQIPSTSARNLYTSKLNTASPPVPVRTAFTSALTAADMKTTSYVLPPPATQVSPPSNSQWNEYPLKGSWALNAEGLADEVIAFVRGCTFGTGVETTDSAPAPDGNKPCEQRPWLLGDIFHSDPIVVRNPPDRVLGSAYDTFRNAYMDRERIIYTGTNGGFLEGFQAGTWNSSNTVYDEGTGVEKFGFMPWEPRTRILLQPIDDPATRAHYVDGAPQVADAWLYPTATTSTQAAADWRTVLVGGLREGGHQYYALDVTNPSNNSGAPAGNLTYPGLKWEFPNEDDYNNSTAGTGCGTTYSCDFLRMGQTWGQPVITRVKLNVGASTNGGAGFERWVAFVTGGYDKTSDPNSTTVDPNAGTYSAASVKGRGIYMLDLKTGNVIARQLVGNPANCTTVTGGLKKPSGTNAADCLDWSLVSTPAVLDIDNDGYADAVFVGDLRGNIWKWVVHPVGEDRANDSNATNDCTGSGACTQPNWKFQLFFQAPSSTISGTTYYKNIFQPPAAAYVNGQLWITFGTGERSAIGFLGASGNTGENNRYYVINDPDPLASAAGAPAIVTEPPSSGSCATGYTCAITDITTSGSPGTRGYYFRTADGEKFVTTSVIFAGGVIAASFTPSQLKSGDPGFDPCTQRGSGNLYQFDLLTGVGDYRDPVTNNPVRYTSLGTGLPTDPKISIGVGGADSEVVIQKSGTEIGTSSTRPPGVGRGVIYWREMP
jgi:Tfp pilus tip-associated adhesin PilY1